MNITRHIRNFLIACFSVLGLTYMYRIRIKRQGPLVRALVFHDVEDSEWFDRVVTHIATRYHIVTPEEFLQAQFDPMRINVLVTFDDGYASWTDVCLPVLASKNIHALFFVNSGLIDTFDNDLLQEAYVRQQLLLSPRKTLTWEGARTLLESGHMVGGHTVTHARLSKLQEDMQKEEIVNDKNRIEEMIGKSITTFAYPFGQRGDYTKETQRYIAEARYSHAFTTEGVFAPVARQYAIPRLCVEDKQSTASIAQWIEGGYDLYYKLKTICAG